MRVRGKKVSLLLLIAIMIMAVSIPVKAAPSYDVQITSNVSTIKQGESVEITIKLKDIVDISGGVAGLSAKLEYDTAKLEKVGDGQALGGFMLVEGNTIELAKYPGVTTDTEIAKFTFKAKDTVTGDAYIKLSGVEIANGVDTIPLGKNVTKTITITAKQQEPQNPPVVLSNNNNLSKLSVDGNIVANFDKNTLTYTLAEVENTKTSINITAESEDTKAKVEGVGQKNLNVGENTFVVVVTAEDGTQKSYKINITRKALVADEGNTDQEDNKEDDTQKEEDNKQEDNTGSNEEKLPQTGVGSTIVIALAVLTISSRIFYGLYKRYKDI